VLIIGWNDTEDAYLCKNSWGATGGPNNDGTFWIAYSGHAHNLYFGMVNFDLASLGGPTIDIEADPNPATVGDPFAVLLDLDNPGDAFFAKIGLYGMIDSRVNRIRSAVVYISAGYSIIDHPFLSVSSLKPVPPTIGFLCVLFNKNTGELLDWDVEVVGVTTAATAAETLALKKLAEKYVKKANVADFKNTKPDILGKAKAAPPLVGQKASPKGKLSTTWGSIKSKR